MDSNSWQRLQELFAQALGLDREGRRSLLEQVEAEDPALCEKLAQLLAADDAESVGMQRGVAAAAAEMLEADSLVGSEIDAYRIVEKTGEGGFGVVYRAQQEEPIRREVALKVIKWGMDTREVIGRFERERQALALMEHPHIARVLDAGSTDQGRPYFVMEFVEGESITEYCARQKLTTPQRLNLFLLICEALQHAHQKGIVHRDIKPSNVLVSTIDGKPTPKVIDFGIAKATEQHQAERTVYTEQRQLIGTPQYMSPEQASGRDIDTRSDIYSLGVLLYELLTGTTPFDPETLRKAAFGEIERIIREVDPPKPSSRIDPATTSTQSKEVQGDLDWIVIKALEKDRERRYESAGTLADDIRRHLNDEPVTAGPPSGLYRMKKFVRRHRTSVAAASLVLVALVVGFSAAAWGFVEASRERDRAEDEASKLRQVSGFLVSLFDISNPNESRGNAVTARELLDEGLAELRGRFADEPQILAELQTTMGNVYHELGLLPQAEGLLEDAVETRKQTLGTEDPETWVAMQSLASLYRSNGRYKDSGVLVEEVLAIQIDALGDTHLETLKSYQLLANLKMAISEDDEAERLYKHVLNARMEKLGPRDPDTLIASTNLGLLYWNMERYDEAEELWFDALALRREILGDDHPSTLWSINKLGNLYRSQGRYELAEPLFVEALETRKRVLGEDHPRTLWSSNDYGLLMTDMGRFDEAEEIHLATLEARRRTLGAEHSNTLGSMTSLAMVYWKSKRLDQAEPLYAEAVEIRRRLFGDRHANTLRTINSLAAVYTALGQYDRAEPLFLEVLEARIAAYGEENPSVLTTRSNLAGLYRRQGRLDQAKSLYAETLEGRRAALGAEHPKTLNTQIGLAEVLAEERDFNGAERLFLDVLTKRTEKLGADHPDVAGTHESYGEMLKGQGRTDEALVAFDKALAIYRATFGDEHPAVKRLVDELGSASR